LIINPASGKVEGVANLNGLKTTIEKEQAIEDTDEVLNGIAIRQRHQPPFCDRETLE